MKKFLALIVILGLIGALIEYWYIVLLIAVLYGAHRIYKNNQQERVHYYEFQNNCVDYDYLDGYDFEYFCADVLVKNGYYDVFVTQSSGDYGVDIIAYQNGFKYAIQCKRFSSNVGNKAVQEIYSGKAMYDADIAVLMTNSYFTRSAIKTANHIGVMLWDRNVLNSMITNALNSSQHRQY